MQEKADPGLITWSLLPRFQSKGTMHPHWLDPTGDNDVDHAVRILNNLQRELKDLMADITKLTDAVTAQTTVVDEAVAKLTAPTTPSQDEVDAAANAVAANTTALQNALPAPVVPPPAA